MKSLYNSQEYNMLVQRIDGLQPGAARQWGTMNASQMLAHCCVPIEIALGDRKMEVSWAGKLFGRFIKGTLLTDKPFKQGIPTDKSFIVSHNPDFDAERQKLLGLLRRFSETEPYVFDGRKHPFFGTLSYLQWCGLMHKHLDHHLRQFSA